MELYQCIPANIRRAATQAGSVDPSAKVAVLVPYRNSDPNHPRAEHLRQFTAHMTEHLRPNTKVFVVEQSEDGRGFNRGRLLNIGYDLAHDEGYSRFIFHDVDLLPNEALIIAAYGPDTPSPLHIAKLWDRYNNDPHYFGGIVSMTGEHYRMSNGFPNNFEKWGGEDQAQYRRLQRAGIRVHVPRVTGGAIRDLEEMDLTQKLASLKLGGKGEGSYKNITKNEQLAVDREGWRTDGLNDLNYQVLARNDLSPIVEKITVEW